MKLLMRKQTDNELFLELRVVSIILGIVMILFFIAGVFWSGIKEKWYGFLLLFVGSLLIGHAAQKYINEHPKIKAAMIWILLALLTFSILFFCILLKRIS